MRYAHDLCHHFGCWHEFTPNGHHRFLASFTAIGTILSLGQVGIAHQADLGRGRISQNRLHFATPVAIGDLYGSLCAFVVSLEPDRPFLPGFCR